MAVELIRPYQQSDWHSICEVHDSSRVYELTPTIGMDAFLPLEFAAENEGLFDGELDVLEVDGRVVGFVAWAGEELTWLYVDPAHFNNGYGRRLLRHAIERVGPVIRTEVLEGNLVAEQLYLKEGFVVKERKSGRLAGNEGFSAVGLYLERIAERCGAEQ
jgi:GNAT superfamily N-acetyltransferase